MTEFKIEKGVKAPAAKNQSKYPFYELEIGDSFEVLLSQSKQDHVYKLQNSLSNSAKAILGRGCFRTQINNERQSVRVWRLA